MNPATRPAAKSMGKGPRPKAKSAPGIPFRPVHVVLGLVLIMAGMLKLSQFADDARDMSFPTLLLMAFFEVEFLAGVAMVAGLRPDWAHRGAVAAFAGFAASNLFQPLSGRCSCGCFGEWPVHPWAVLLLDLVALGFLAGCRRPIDPETNEPVPLWRNPGSAILALLVGAAAWQQAGLVTIAGTATRGSQPLKLTPLIFTGESGRIAVRTDADGHFRLPLVRPGPYTVAVPGPRPVPRPAPAQQRPATAAPRGRAAPAPSPTRTDTGASLVWIEVSGCSGSPEDIDVSDHP